MTFSLLKGQLQVSDNPIWVVLHITVHTCIILYPSMHIFVQGYSRNRLWKSPDYVKMSFDVICTTTPYHTTTFWKTLGGFGSVAFLPDIQSTKKIEQLYIIHSYWIMILMFHSFSESFYMLLLFYLSWRVCYLLQLLESRDYIGIYCAHVSSS